jgi:hypothetical protein
MGFFSKLAFWKKDDSLGDFGLPTQNLDMGFNSASNMPMSQGLPDMRNFRGVGDQQAQQDMNMSIHNQMGDDYMNQPTGSYARFSRQDFESPKPAYSAPSNSGNQFEIVSAKLDAIKANLDAINQRLANIERLAYGEQDKKRYQW